MSQTSGYRILDASFNRLAEGLRVIEEVARFILNDARITEELRRLRHQLREYASKLQVELLASRDAAGDVGAAQELRGRADLASLVTANAKRAQESLRVIEEVCQLPDAPFPPEPFRDARFTLYGVEKELLSHLWRHQRRAGVSGLYVIVDTGFLRGRKEVEVARQALEGGARVIQLRDKSGDKGKLLPVARALQELCRERGALFLVNDHLDLALASGADGLHLGQTDLPVSIARRYLPPDRLIGVSARTREQARKAAAEGADYVAVGSIYPTASKPDAVVRGLEALKEVKAAVSLPVVAIGGINRDNLVPVVQAGADAIAVISAVMAAEDAAQAARELVERMEAARVG